MQQSQIFWKWVGRVGGVVGLIGGGLAIYAFVGGRLLAFIIWGLAASAVLISRMRRGVVEPRGERIEAKVDSPTSMSTRIWATGMGLARVQRPSPGRG